MNRKAQETGPLAYIILLLVFVLMWFLWLGGFVNDMGEYAINSAGYTGIEAFFYSNMNIFIFIGLIIGTMAYLYLRGG